MRPIASCASSTALTFLVASAADNSTAVLKLHSDLAKAHSRFAFAARMMLSLRSCRKSNGCTAAGS
jgi:hypothetical protein